MPQEDLHKTVFIQPTDKYKTTIYSPEEVLAQQEAAERKRRGEQAEPEQG